jgi:hypothetical protein
VEKKALLTVAFISVLLFSAAATFFVKSTQANPYIHDYKGTEVSPPTGTQPPAIIIHTPQNGSFYQKNLNLTFDVIIPNTNGDKSVRTVTKLYYKATWEPNEITISEQEYGVRESTSFSIDLSGVSGGNHSITIYAVGHGFYEANTVVNGIFVTHYYNRFELIGSSTVSFIKDVVPPRISFLSPQNGTYVTSDVELDFIVSEAASEILYCLDGKENQTITDSLTLTGLAEGAHNVTLYAADFAGNAAAPQTVFFNVDLPESFPTMPVTASIATVALVSFGLGILAYFKKRKRQVIALFSTPCAP